MHSLRYALGDSLFFEILYRFITDPEYTYKNTVETEDFLIHVNNISGEDYTDFFELFLETTRLPNVVVDSLGNGQWNVSIPNIDFKLSMELEIDGRRIRSILSSNPVTIESESRVIIDPLKWYLHESDFKEN